MTVSKRSLPAEFAQTDDQTPPLSEIKLIHALPEFISPNDVLTSAGTDGQSNDIDLASINVLKWSGSVTLKILPKVSCLNEIAGDGVQGMLYVATSRLYYFNRAVSKGLAITYPAIGVHAISRSPVPSIYCQLDSLVTDESLLADDVQVEGDSKTVAVSNTETEGTEEIEDDDVEMGEDEDETSEMVIIPQDLGCVDAIFNELSNCAILHPDLFDEEEDEEDDDMMNAFMGNLFIPLFPPHQR
ncbi:regulator of volume decrease after cellular swelling-domain-containing protein, partial [Paraphysoderma sedebokerense]